MAQKRKEKKPGKTFAKLLVDVVASEAARCADDPNIVTVGYGLKIVKGKPHIRTAIQYHVIEKLGSKKSIVAAGSTMIPKEVEGYETDVLPVEIGKPATCPDSNSPTGERGSRQEDPLVGGTSTTSLSDFHSIPTGYGTLGGICFDAATGSADAMALSNAHVYGDNIGADVIQPWLPGSEYLEASLKYLFCGGPLSHLFFWTAPSPLTAILTTAAAGAWIAAIASDAEDPSRWGQRVGTVPATGVRTDREKVHIEAEIPRLPLPGRVWESQTKWNYIRATTAGDTHEAITEKRANEHVLVGKRVFTDRPQYRPGQRVTICAQLYSMRKTPAERFVVANCFPLSDPERVIKRVLSTKDDVCPRTDKGITKYYPPVCLRGFEPQVAGLTQIVFPIIAQGFIIASNAPESTLHLSSVSSNPSGVDALRIPDPDSLIITCPPSTNVELGVYHFNDPVVASAYSANGALVQQATSSHDQGTLQTLKLTGPEIVRIEVEGGGGEGFVAGLCVNKWPIKEPSRVYRDKWYSGYLDLSRTELPGDWAVVVVSQTLDDTATGGDPVRAARLLGGIVDSSNVVETSQCVCTILYDHIFRVVSPTRNLTVLEPIG
jgi:hypothetical protein